MSDTNKKLLRALSRVEREAGGPIDWTHWGALVTVLDWEAVWLSLGLDPGRAARAQGRMSLGMQLIDGRYEVLPFHFDLDDFEAVEEDFNTLCAEHAARSRAIRNWIESDALWSRCVQTFDPEFGRPEIQEVRLVELAERCVMSGWYVADAFRQLSLSSASSGGGPWPWGIYETALLRNLAEAGRKFWVNYDSTDPTTAHTNQDVVDFLVGRGVSQRIAEAMAQILRADGLRPGPRPGARSKEDSGTR
jgi:hypothetical protein